MPSHWCLILITVILANIQARRSRKINSSWRTLSSSGRSVQHSALFTLRVHVFCVLLCSDKVTAISPKFDFHVVIQQNFLPFLKEALSVLMLCAPVFIIIYIRQLNPFRPPTLWFINLAVATCHIQYTFLSLCQFFLRENGEKNTKILKVRHFRIIRKWPSSVIRRAKH